MLQNCTIVWFQYELHINKHAGDTEEFCEQEGTLCGRGRMEKERKITKLEQKDSWKRNLNIKAGM